MRASVSNQEHDSFDPHRKDVGMSPILQEGAMEPGKSSPAVSFGGMLSERKRLLLCTRPEMMQFLLKECRGHAASFPAVRSIDCRVRTEFCRYSVRGHE
jgi:hypothetical protein